MPVEPRLPLWQRNVNHASDYGESQVKRPMIKRPETLPRPYACSLRYKVAAHLIIPKEAIAIKKRTWLHQAALIHFASTSYPLITLWPGLRRIGPDISLSHVSVVQ
jgi:hypothetical protein